MPFLDEMAILEIRVATLEDFLKDLFDGIKRIEEHQNAKNRKHTESQ